MQHDIAKKTMESKKAHIKNLSDYDLTRDEINLLSRGLNYIPTPVTNESHIRKELLKDFAAFARRMRLQFIFHGRDKRPHPFPSEETFEELGVIQITFRRTFFQKLNLAKDRRRYKINKRRTKEFHPL